MAGLYGSLTVTVHCTLTTTSLYTAHSGSGKCTRMKLMGVGLVFVLTHSTHLTNLMHNTCSLVVNSYNIVNK